MLPPQVRLFCFEKLLTGTIYPALAICYYIYSNKKGRRNIKK